MESRLAALRAKIDALDLDIHRALIERASVVAELSEVKTVGEPGRVFKPGREAEMMRRLAQRHTGSVPLQAIEHIWREIIATFTTLQAPFRVHVAQGDDPAVRELARYVFGFTPPLVSAGTAEQAISALSDDGNALALVPIVALSAVSWWDALSPEGPCIIARVPAFPLPAHMTTATAFVVGVTAADETSNMRTVLSVVGADEQTVRTSLIAKGGALLSRGPQSQSDAREMLVALPEEIVEDWTHALRETTPHVSARLVGHYAAPLNVSASATSIDAT
ncbi:MAG: chorismate mutase [Pseudomonadota bacterium]